MNRPGEFVRPGRSQGRTERLGIDFRSKEELLRAIGDRNLAGVVDGLPSRPNLRRVAKAVWIRQVRIEVEAHLDVSKAAATTSR